MPYLIDTHFHPDLHDQNATTILAAARDAGVEAFIAIGSDLPSSEAANCLAEQQRDVWATAGLHPHEADSFDGNVQPFKMLARRPRNCAVGEIGLDYHYEHSGRDTQRRVFARFLQLAMEEKLPAVIHCREAYDDCLRLLRDELPKGHPFEIHSYTGPDDLVGAFLELGAFVSFNGIVTFKKADNVRAALQQVPLDRLLLETDAPYLAPPPHRGRPNQPAYLVHTAEFVAGQKGVSLDELARVTSDNARELFPGLKT